MPESLRRTWFASAPSFRRAARSSRAKKALKYLNHGEVVFAVIAENSTREPHRLVVSSIGVAIPADKDTYGYLSEHHSFGETEDQAGEYAEELAAEMLATTLDVDFDPDKSWDKKKEIYRISNKIVRTSNVTQSAVGDKRGLVDYDDRRGGSDSGRVGAAGIHSQANPATGVGLVV